MKVLEGRAPSVSEPGMDVGLAVPLDNSGQVIDFAGRLERAIRRRDPAVDPQDITYHVEER